MIRPVVLYNKILVLSVAWFISVDDLVTVVLELCVEFFHSFLDFLAMTFHFLYPFLSGFGHFLTQSGFFLVRSVFECFAVEFTFHFVGGSSESFSKLFDFGVISYEFSKGAFFSNFVPAFLRVTPALLALLKGSFETLFSFSGILFLSATLRLFFLRFLWFRLGNLGLCRC